MRMFLTHSATASTTQTTPVYGIPYPQRVHYFPETYKRKDTGLVYAPHKLANMVWDQKVIQWLVDNPVTGRTAFILAGGNQHFAGINPIDMPPDSPFNYQYKFLPLSLTNVYAGRLAGQLPDMDWIHTDATACVSSLKVMTDVKFLARLGFDRVIVLAVEDAVSNTVLQFFGESGASLTLEQEESLVKPSAFDTLNRGFYVGQGAALAVFHSEDALWDLGINPKAELHGAWHAAEHNSNAIGQRDDGLGYIKAIEGAIEMADCYCGEITIVKTHGTGTPSNNKAEKAALDGTLKDFIATSYKQKIGHTMGASGLLETILLLENIAAGVVPAIANRTEEDAVFLSEDTEAPEGLVLSLAAGMGNVYSAAIFEPLGV